MERLREKAAVFGIALSDHQLEQFEMYYKMLVEKNKVMNLTAITEKNEVINTLGLQKITAIHGRAEDFAKQKEYRENFDYVVSRAVANLTVLSEYCIPYVKEGGYFLPYKSGDIKEEAKNSKKAVKILGGNIEDIISFEIPDTDMARTILKIHKTKATPKRFPRKAGLPSKEPIC